MALQQVDLHVLSVTSFSTAADRTDTFRLSTAESRSNTVLGVPGAAP